MVRRTEFAYKRSENAEASNFIQKTAAENEDLLAEIFTRLLQTQEVLS